jgi:hypothetical protein
VARLLIFLLFWPAVSLAEGPSACDPREEYTICELKVERNNAMDELAIATGKLRTTQEREAKLVKWVTEYIEGVNSQSDWWKRYTDGLAAWWAQLTEAPNAKPHR